MQSARPSAVYCPLPMSIRSVIAEYIAEFRESPGFEPSELPHIVLSDAAVLHDETLESALNGFDPIEVTFGEMAVFEDDGRLCLGVSLESADLQALQSEVGAAGYRSRIPLAYSDNTDIYEFDGVPLTITGQDAVVGRVIVQDSDTRRQYTLLGASAGLDVQTAFGKAQKPAESDTGRLVAIAEILFGVYGEDALEMLGGGSEFLKAWDESKHVRDARGRFAPKNGPKDVEAIRGAIQEALRGKRTKRSVFDLVDRLGELTLPQLNDLKRKYGVSASGRTKRDLVKKIADRLDRGRREQPEDSGESAVELPTKKDVESFQYDYEKAVFENGDESWLYNRMKNRKPAKNWGLETVDDADMKKLVAYQLGAWGKNPDDYVLVEVPVSEVTPSQTGSDYDNESSRVQSESIGTWLGTGRAEDYAPILVNEDGVIIDGNHRHASRAIAGVEKIQVLTPKGGKLTDPKREHEVVGKPRYATVNDFNLDADDSRMQRIAQGDSEAFNDLVSEYQKPLERHILPKVRDVQLAEDITQETLLRVHNAAKDYKPDGKFKGWLYRVAGNIVRDKGRRTNARIKTVGGTDSEGNDMLSQAAGSGRESSSVASESELFRTVDRILQKLPPEQREAWQMANNDGLSTEEIAAATGVARNTAKSRVRLARERIADELAQVDESYRELVRKALFQDFDGLLLKSVTPVSRAVFDTMFAKFGANCGTGAGGFQPGNTCGSHEQSVTSDGTLRISAEQARQLLPKQPKKWKLSGDGFQHIRQAAKGMPEATTREVVQHLIDSEGEPLTSWAVSQSQTDKLMDRWYSNASKFMDESGDGIEYMEIDGESYEDWFIDNFAVDDEQVLSDIVSQYDERMAKRRSFEKSMFSKAFCRTGKGGGVDNSCGRESDSKHPVMPTKRKLKGLVSAYLQVTKDRRGAQKIINTYDAIVKRKLKREGYDTVEEFAFQQVLSTLRKRNPEIHRKVLRLFDPWFRGEVKLPERSYALAKSLVDGILGADDAGDNGAFWKSADNCGTGAGGFQPGNTCGKNKRSEWNDGKTGAELTIPEVGNRVQFDVRISDVQDQPGYIRIDSDYGKAYIPEESLSHFYSDMTGDMSILGETGDPAVDSVARGEGRMIGKGNDSVAFEIGDEIVKVSSTVPYHPVGGPPHRTVKQMMTEAKAAQSVFQELKEAGVPGLPETRFLDLGNKLVSVQPKLTVTEDLNEKQLKQLRDSVIAIHKQGYAIGDQLQFGIDSSGNVQHFDITSAYKPSDKIRMYDEEREVASLFKKNGVQYYMSVEQALSDFGQAKEMIERRGKVKPHTKLMLQEAHAALSDASHEMEWDILDYMEANGVPTLWEESNTKIEKSMFSSIFGKSLNNVGDKSELVAEILLGVFGESVLSEAGFLKAWYTWNEADHPRDERGRFARKEDAIGEARSLIKTALQGRKTADSAKELASVLGTLSVKELHSLKREYNISASGLKRELIGKIADRLDSGRRKDYSTEPEKQDRFELEQPRKERKKAKFDAIPQGKQGEMFDLGRNDLEGQNLLFNTDAGAGDDPTTMESKVKLSKFKQAVQDAALENELEPDVLENAVEEIWDLNRSYHNQREDMKKEIRRVMQINAGDVSRIENGNLDLDSVRGFDEGLQELMTAYPDIAVANDPEQFVWGLLREGKIDPPAKHSKEIIDEAVQYVIGSKTQPVEYAGNFDTEDWFLRSMVSAWNSGHRGGMLLKSSMLGNGDTTTVAEILLSVYGPQVVGWFGSNMDVMKAWRTWDESQHPRDARGRFTNKDDNFDEVSAKIRAALKGRKTKESAVELAGMLMKLRVSDLHRIRKEFGLSASGLKRELVEKLAQRLDSGRRDDYSMEPVKGETVSNGQSPRDTAQHYYDSQKHGEFAWARVSDVGNVGEDLLGSARHRRNEWRTLEELESRGAEIAAKAITRDNLLKRDPPELSSYADTKPIVALSMHYAMKSLPKDPYPHDRFSDEQKVIARQLYVRHFERMKAKAEDLVRTETDASVAIDEFGKELLAVYSEPWSKDVSDMDSAERVVAQRCSRMWFNAARQNATKTYSGGFSPVTDKVGRFDKKNATLTKVKMFAVQAKEHFGEQWQTAEGSSGQGESVSDKVISLMEGKSLPSVFGKKGQGTSRPRFNYADAYVNTAVRVGGDYTANSVSDAKSKLSSSMGLRGIQYGNSMTDEEREHHTMKTAEAFVDLADVLNVKDSAIGIDNKLGMAFGARGIAGAKAHYEPDSKVINLTRRHGSGSLAHEWFHFMDHTGTDGTGFGSRSNNEHFAALRKSWAVAKERIRKVASDNFLDPSYWTSDVEMYARYSERYTQVRLREMGRENTYLVGLKKSGHPLWPNDAELAESRPHLEAIIDAFRGKHGASNDDARAERVAKMFSVLSGNSAFDTLFGKCMSTKDGESGGYLAKCPCGGADPEKCTCDEKPVVKCNGRKCGCGKKADFVRRAFDKVFSA